jgi:von Willebrand factor type A C-terminal domain/von Willebrand factor type A domain
MSSFIADVFQNEYLPRGAGVVDAIVTVSASGSGAKPRAVAAAEVIVIDTSGSMTGRKLRSAKAATKVAIDCIRDGTLFAVVAGTHEAEVVFPPDGRLAPASADARGEAKQAVSRLQAAGGTAIGTWLACANEVFAGSTDTINHAILLTDGKDENESPRELEQAVAACIGRFQCDCRGVGTDWEVGELRQVASALLGSVDIVPKPEGLEDDFRSLIEQAMAKQTNDVALRLWTPQGASVAFVKQVSPTVDDLTVHASVRDAQTVDYPTGSWGDESRDYHLRIDVAPHEVGEEMLAGRVSLVVDGEPVGQALVRAIWTDDEQLSTRINREVAHYTGQAELAAAIRDGLEARRSGDDARATVRLGRAVQLAAASGNDATLGLLAKVVEIDDPATGAVRPRPRVEDADEMALDTRSTRSVRVKGSA